MGEVTVDSGDSGVQDAAAQKAHNDAMIARAEGRQPPAEPNNTPDDAPAQEPKPERPDDVPEKFWDAEKGAVRVDALLKSYRELESARGRGEAADDKPADDDDAAAARGALDQRGLNLDEFTREFQERGELTPASYEKLEQSGLSKHVVDDFIAGQQARQQIFMSAVQEAAGGAKEQQALFEWASSLPEDEIARANEVLASGDIERAKSVIRDLKSRREEAMGRDPSLVDGVARGAAGGESFSNWAQVKKAMSDPRYQTDAAYRSQVEQKLARSNI